MLEIIFQLSKVDLYNINVYVVLAYIPEYGT